MSRINYNKQPSVRRGSVMLVVIIALVVVGTIALSLMLVAQGTFMTGRRQPRLAGLRAMADAGVQYGYWQIEYQNASLPYSAPNQALGPGSFSVKVTDNSAVLPNTLKIVSTAVVGSDTFAETRVVNNGPPDPPSAPGNFLLAPGNTSISLTWLPSPGATSYQILRGTVANGESAIPVATPAGTSYRDTGLTNGKSYYYKLVAVSAGGASTYSTELTAKPKNSNLSGTRATGLSSVDLTTEAQTDWTEWGLDPFDHKSTGGGQISTYTQVGGTKAVAYTGQTSLLWADGSPTLNEPGTTSVLSITGVGNGFQFTAPADTSYRTLRLYMGVEHGKAQVKAALSDGSSAAYSDTGIHTIGAAGPPVSGTYTFVYKAGKAGQTLTVTVTLRTNQGVGKISLQGATLF